MENKPTITLDHLPLEDISREAISWSCEQWKENTPKLTAEQIGHLIPFITPAHSPKDWHEKLIYALTDLYECSKLEAVGKSLSLIQCHMLLNHATEAVTLFEKLSPIFVGLNHDIFCAFLLTAEPNELSILKQGALTEAIQHHLTLLVSFLITKENDIHLQIINKMHELENLSLVDIRAGEITSFRKTIDELNQQGLTLIQMVNNALAIAWNTLRLDLIEKLSLQKESIQRIIKFEVGTNQEVASESVGLYAQLDKLLNSIYADPNISAEAFNDDIPAIEALSKLGLWYLQDYWDMGLLPNVAKEDVIQVNHNGDVNALELQQKLFKVTNDNLNTLGLSTLKDLKQANIYSKAALKEFVSAQLNKYPNNQ